MTNASREQAEQAKSRAKEILGDLTEVVGVGLTKVGESWAVKINLAAPLASPRMVPTTVDGVPVQVEVVGAIHAPLGSR